MGNINIISEKVYGQYKYSNEAVNASGSYLKNGINNSLQTVSGTCYSANEDNIFYGSFNGRLSESEENKMEYTIYEKKPEYKEIIEAAIAEIEKSI